MKDSNRRQNTETHNKTSVVIIIHSQSYEKYIAYLDYKLGTPYLLIVCLVPGSFSECHRVILPQGGAESSIMEVKLLEIFYPKNSSGC